jgi:hypothetical protein
LMRNAHRTPQVNVRTGDRTVNHEIVGLVI